MTIKEVSEKYGISQDTLRYYEKIGAIPPVTRTAGGVRNFTDADIGWVENAVCMRGAGLPVDVIAEYCRLYSMGDSTISARLKLLTDQRQKLIAQKEQLEAEIARLNYKIERYEIAEKTGVLSWDKNSCK
ncbi:MAG: MerR family transcriptional regulator [Oscillospiraceae bacterium]